MPFIHTITNRTVTTEEEAQLRRRLGQAIATIPGKSEQWLMLALSDDCRMAFRGKADEQLVMLDVSMLGTASDAALNKLTRVLSDVIDEVLHIPSDHVYIKYTMTDHWGFGGENF